MWECLVKLPDSSLIEIQLDSESVLGTELISQVCRRLGTVESDYFGLQIPHKLGNSTERYWLNLRNKLKNQLKSTPHRVDLRVKFYVEPHHILQEKTRLLMFSNIKQDFRENILRHPSIEHAICLTAHIAQGLHGNYSKYSEVCLHEHYLQILPVNLLSTREVLNRVLDEHIKLLGQKPNTAVYNTLKIASSWEHFGEEYHDVTAEGSTMFLGAGPQGITLYDKDWHCQFKFSYPAVLKATHSGKTFSLQTVNDDGSEQKQVFKLHSTDASKALYRCVTEMYLFYLCDTVKNDVSSQFCRDLKGTLVSIFNEKTELGKRYVFDIQRTLKEVNDHTRRELLRMKSGGNRGGTSLLQEPAVSDFGSLESCGDKSVRPRRHSWCANDKSQPENDRHEEKEESFLCQVCMDKDLDTVFIPCGHASCCDSCASLIDTCPICRTPITTKQHLYLPTRMRHASR